MPFTGGASPSPERYGAGEGIDSNVPLVQRIYETISRGRGSAYDQSWPPTTAVGVENLAYARAIAFDVWGTNTRLANECNPAKATVGGLLPRWEKILNCPPNYNDTQPIRQARCAAKLAMFGQASIEQAIVTFVTVALGPIYVGIVHFDPPGAGAGNAMVWWPGLQGTAGLIAAGGPPTNQIAITGLANVPTGAPGTNITLSNCFAPANNGTFSVQSLLSSSSVIYINNNPGVLVEDFGIGGTALAPTIVWSISNPNAPWFSTSCQVDFQVTTTPAVGGYANTDGSPNGLFWSTLGNAISGLDEILPAWMKVQFYVNSSHGSMGFYLDEHDLDLEAFSS